MDAPSYDTKARARRAAGAGHADRWQLALPANATNWISVWRRNYLVWRKLAAASMLGNLADPMIYLFGLGFGLGLMVGRVDGVSYIAYLAAGTVGSSVMMSATFESMYSSFSRMHVQRTWEAIMHTPLTLGDIVVGEIVWAGSKAVLSGAAIMLVAAGLLITTTIRLSALSRRRETTIMRMVGSSRTLIQAPFLLEGAVAATLGAVLAVGALYASVRYVVGDWLRASLTWIPYIGEADVLAVAPYLVAIAVALAAAASVVTLGKYTRA